MAPLQICDMIHYVTYRGAVVGLRGAVVGVRGAAVGVRGAAVGNIGIPTYVISRGAVVRQPNIDLSMMLFCFYYTSIAGLMGTADFGQFSSYELSYCSK